MNRVVRTLLLAGALVSAPLSVTPVFAASAYGDQTLSVGTSGTEVSELQQDLRLLGYFTYEKNTGYYGEITEAAVKAFQKDNKLEENGKVGLSTGPLIHELADKKRPAESDKASKIIATAKQYVGVPYQWGGTSPSGFDCSGFVNYVMGKYEIDLPRTAAEMYQSGTAVKDLQAGDLVFFTTYASGASHAGIYIGDGQFISATSSNGVKIDSFSNSYWGPRYIGARRVF